MTYYIVGGGEFDAERFSPEKKDRVFAADAGYAALEQINICPDAVIGDFDSLGCLPEHHNILRFFKEKDETDMALCARIAEEQGADRILLFGGTGGRIDHTLANFALLGELSARGIAAFLFGKDFTATALTDGTLAFPEDYRGTVSVFCWGKPALGVTETGLYYSVENATLDAFVPLGVSNEFTGTPAAVRVTNGTLLVLWEDRSCKELPVFQKEKRL